MVHSMVHDYHGVAHSGPSVGWSGRHHGGLPHAQRLDSGAQPAVHDKGIHLAEEYTKVRALCLEQLAGRSELGHLRSSSSSGKASPLLLHCYPTTPRTTITSTTITTTTSSTTSITTTTCSAIAAGTGSGWRLPT